MASQNIDANEIEDGSIQIIPLAARPKSINLSLFFIAPS
jgi:hypothetical protein